MRIDGQDGTSLASPRRHVAGLQVAGPFADQWAQMPGAVAPDQHVAWARTGRSRLTIGQ